MNKIYREQFQISTIHLDRFGRMKNSMILYFAQEVATNHCKILGCDWDAMAAKGLFWAVIRHRIHIGRLPRDGETITIETWPMPTTRTCYPRSMVAFDAQGNERMVHGRCEGWIGFERRGEGGFGYEPVFCLWNNFTLAELGREKKDQRSHRSRACHKLAFILGNTKKIRMR